MLKAIRKRILEKIEKLNIWRSGGNRAPHKPLLVLLALSRVLRGEKRMVTFSEIEGKLAELLRRYGTSKKTAINPRYPFWYLRRDGIWQLRGTSKIDVSAEIPRIRDLRKMEGGFPKNVYSTLHGNVGFTKEIARLLLNEHFPYSYHEDILADLGIDLNISGKNDKRDPEFRTRVLSAYEHRCTICDYDLKIDNEDLALQAAHIKWHSEGGPDIVQNGLALCVVHHKAFDRGAISLDDSLRVKVSGRMHGRGLIADLFLKFNGKPIRRPHSSSLKPDLEYVAWHRDQVFRTPARQ